MLRRLPRTLVVLAAALGALLTTFVSMSAQAAPKDKAAMKLYEDAMDEDYLNTDFDSAIEKLKDAIKTCGKKDCSKQVLGKLHVGLGIVYGGGKNDKGKAKAEFAKAFKADKDAKPLEDYMTGALTKLFNEAQKGAGGGDDDDDSGDDDDDSGDDDDDDDDAAGDFEYNPPDAARVNTPLPIFVKVPEDIGKGTLKLRYKPFGGTSWESVSMKKMKGGFGGVIPCSQLSTTGELKLYIIVKDKEGDPIATAGTRKQPLTVEIKNKLDGDQPSLPGQEPPEQCVAKGDCPPDFPGCSAGGGARGDKGWGASCDATKECRSGLVCLNGSCEQGEGDDDDDDDDDGGGGSEEPGSLGLHQHYISLGIQLDLLALDGAENVCGVYEDGEFTQELDNYFCYDKSGEFLGKPMDKKFNEIEGGLALAGARILLGYDLRFWRGLSGGVRLGFAFGGSPSVGDAEERYKDCKDEWGKAECREPLASDFMPAHVEGRVSYQFMHEGLVRPYGFVGGGLAQVNAGVTVAVCDAAGDDGGEAPDPDEKCDNIGEKRDDIEAYQVTGLNFFGFGAGAIIAVTDMIGVNVEAKFMVMLPTFGFVIAPSVAPVFMF